MEPDPFHRQEAAQDQREREYARQGPNQQQAFRGHGNNRWRISTNQIRGSKRVLNVAIKPATPLKRIVHPSDQFHREGG